MCFETKKHLRKKITFFIQFLNELVLVYFKKLFIIEKCDLNILFQNLLVIANLHIEKREKKCSLGYFSNKTLEVPFS